MFNSTSFSLNRKYKDSLFRLLFSESKENALSLYNALNETNYDNPDELEMTTLDDVIYLKQKNDVSFIIGNTLNLYEHQSTFCPNRPLRGFFYFADLLRQRFKVSERIYSRKLVTIPTPSYIVFYNGQDKKLNEDILKLHLSDAFEVPDHSGEFEWTATVVNINGGRNQKLKESCKILSDYCTFVDTLRKNRGIFCNIQDAVNITVDTCIENDVLREFLLKNKLEVNNMCLTEFDEETYIQIIREDLYDEARIEGLEKGLEEGREKGLAEGEAKANAAYQQLISCLVADKRLNVLEDPNVSMKELFNEYGIETSL